MAILEPVVLNVALWYIPDIVLGIPTSIVHALVLWLLVDIVILMRIWDLVGSISVPINNLWLIEGIAAALVIRLLDSLKKDSLVVISWVVITVM